MLNCCSQDNTNSRSDYTVGKNINNDINNNPFINKNHNNNNNEENKGGSSRLPKREQKEDKENPVSGFRRTKTKHFK